MLCVISLSASCSFDRDYDFKNIELVIGFVVVMTRTIIPQWNHALRFDRRTLPIDSTAFAKSAKNHSPYGDTRFHRWWLHRLPRNYLGHASVPKSVARLSTSNQIRNLPCKTHSECTKSRWKLSTKLASGARMVPGFFWCTTSETRENCEFIRILRAMDRLAATPYFLSRKTTRSDKVLEHSELQRVRRVPRLALLGRRSSDGEVFNRW